MVVSATEVHAAAPARQEAAQARALPGCPHPLGARPYPGGVNFSVYAGDAQRVELLLYDHVDAAEPRLRIDLAAAPHRTWHYWHACVPGIGPGQLYGYAAHGLHDASRGLRFDADKVLLDPYGRAVALPRAWSRQAACLPGRNDARAAKSVVADDHAYDWQGDAPLRRPFTQTVIYELHVRGLTRHPSSGVAAPRAGTYAGLVEKIPYLLDLGVTAVELMPVFQFDPQDAPPGLANYWGYAPVSFFAPHAGYAQPGTSPLAVLDEFRDMVRALHRAGIEVILDVVYNHTAEGNELGPTLGLRGLANATYYLLDENGRYANYSGCGNTLNANHPVVRRLILDSLHYWVQVMHVDGFRFDLAAILSRDERGRPQPDAPVLWDIESDPVLAGTKLIAEAWDAAGLVQVGHFVGERWKEWNGHFRDDVRDFVRGAPGTVARLADRLLGSPDLYGARPREPAQSVNFVTSHDGFTLHDLVTYETPRNEANRECNHDGSRDNRSWNCGVEGESEDVAVRGLRARQARNLLAITVLSLGTPMLAMGDEMGRTLGGNNNAYCHDEAWNWLDWGGQAREPGLHRFVRGLIALRNLRESVREDHRLTLAELMRLVRVQLHGVHLGAPDMRAESRSLAVTATSLSGDLLMHFALNARAQALDFELPPLPPDVRGPWRRVLDSARPSPEDLHEMRTLDELEGAPPVPGPTHRVQAHSVVTLFARVRLRAPASPPPGPPAAGTPARA
jgi:glycogen operon protein